MIATNQSASGVSTTASTGRLSDSTLDSILVWQFVVAWAGEGYCVPPRLGWWRTDLIDDAGGGDFLKRLLPKTHLWASLEAMRQAAIQIDQQKRQRLAEADQVNTLFFWGFSLDEQLKDRLAVHKRSQRAPAEQLDLPLDLWAAFVQTDLEAVLNIPTASDGQGYELVTEGRAMQGTPPQSLELRSQRLAAALLPLTDEYSMPFYPMAAAQEDSHAS